MRRTDGPYRPDITTHAEMIAAIRARLSEVDLVETLSDTDVVKIAVERMFRAAYPGRSVVSPRRRMYIPLIH